jgi:hypothetical protein
MSTITAPRFMARAAIVGAAWAWKPPGTNTAPTMIGGERVALHVAR